MSHRDHDLIIDFSDNNISGINPFDSAKFCAQDGFIDVGLTTLFRNNERIELVLFVSNLNCKSRPVYPSLVVFLVDYTIVRC